MSTLKVPKTEPVLPKTEPESKVPPVGNQNGSNSTATWQQQLNNNLAQPPTANQLNPMVVHLSHNFHLQSLQNHSTPLNSNVLHSQSVGSISHDQIGVGSGCSKMESMDNSPGSSGTASNADVSTSLGNGSNADNSGDAEGVWSADIDQAFQEALQIYPPCGRRKIILSDEGKMFGRNELIARYIKLRCGKTRTRKQVSSHIQVLARKKNREIQSKVKAQDSKFSFDECSSMGQRAPAQPQQPQQLNPNSVAINASSISNASRPKISSSVSPSTVDMNHVNQQQQQQASINPGFVGGISAASIADAAAAVASDLFHAAAVGAHPSANTNVATAALAAVAAGIKPSAVSGWPYNVNTNAVLNNYYTASMMNDENLYEQFAAAALAASSLPGSLNAQQQQASFRQIQSTAAAPCSLDCTIASSKLTLCGFQAYIEQVVEHPKRVDLVRIPKVSDEPLETIKLEAIQSKYPQFLQDLFREGPSDAFFLVKCWANVQFDMTDEKNTLYAVDSFYDSTQKCDISVSTKVCSFGKQVVEKVEVYSPIDEETGADGRPLYRFRLEKSPMCEYMVRFIAELKKLDKHPLMNSVLDNFTVLQVVTNKATTETLMVIAFIFEVSDEPESTCRIYRLSS